MILPVANQDVAVGHDRHSFEPFEFRRAGTPSSKGPQESAVGMEDLNAVVA